MTQDNFGNPTLITATTTGGGETFVTTTTNTYTNDTANWFLGRLTRAEVTNTLPDLSSATRVSEFSYNAQTGLLTQEVIEPGTALALTTTYAYDAFGNQLTATTSGPDIVSRTSNSSYTPDGRFAASATNALGHTETRAFDGRFGTATSLTGPNNLTTTWAYDGFGRTVREARADGTETTWSYDLCAGQCPAGAVYLVEQRQIVTATGFDYAARSKVYFDKLDRELRSESEGFDGTPVNADTLFNALGQVTQTSRPYFQGTAAQDIQWTTATYDDAGRPDTTTAPDGGISSVAYAGLTTTTTNALNQDAIQTKNALGQVITVTDHLGASNDYFYDPFGNLEETADDAGNQVFMTYDIRGRKTAMDDPDMGAWSYDYNALGELTSQTDAKGQIVTMAYDKLGRMVSRSEAEGATTWTYDTATKGVGKIHQVSGPNGYLSVATYDSLGRPSSSSETIFGEVFTTSVTYDSASRIASQTYPTGFAVDFAYTATGFLDQVSENGGSTVYWTAIDINAEGQVTEELLGNGLITQRAYNPETGLPDSIQTWNGPTAVQNDAFVFDLAGNLTQRSSNTQFRQEEFTYDGLNRVTGTTLRDNVTQQVLNTTSYAYDTIGNITWKSDVGSYTYGAGGAGPHAVTAVSGGPAGTLAYAYDLNGNMISGAGRAITWSSFNKPVVIDDGAELTFTYGPNRARIQQKIKTGGGPNNTTTITYVGNLYEKRVPGTNDAEHIHYIRAAGTVAIYTEIDDGNPSTDKTRYLHRDHLDSIVALTDETGAVAEQLSYDPHGKRRAVDWQPAGAPITAQETPRGFTGHEHLDTTGLIHMNGRVYEPTLGRFLSADPIIQFPRSTQGLNRYTYVNNNPLSFTDPSGFFSIDIGGFIDSVVDFFTDAVQAVLQSQVGQIVGSIIAFEAGGPFGAAAFSGFTTLANGGDLGDALLSAATTYAFIRVTAGINASFGGNSFGDRIGKIVAHGAVGGVRSELNGGKFKAGFLAGAVRALGAPLVDKIPGDLGKVVASAVIGGASAKLGGGKFANGAVTVAFSYLFTYASAQAAGSGTTPPGISDKVSADSGLGVTVSGNTLSGDIIVGCTRVSATVCAQSIIEFQAINGSDGTYTVALSIRAAGNNENPTFELFSGGVNAKFDGVFTARRNILGMRVGRQIRLFRGNVNYSSETAVHEFGHLLGLHHQANSTRSFMSYAVNRNTVPVSADIRRLVGGYRWLSESPVVTD